VPSYQYVGDDLTTYQIEQPSAYSTIPQVNLPPAVGTEPVFPSLNVPRYIVALPIANPALNTVHIICDSTSTLWLFGPGTAFSISGNGYEVYSCIGEQRKTI